MASKESALPYLSSNISKRKRHHLRKRKMLHGKQYETEIVYIPSWTCDNTIQTYTKNWKKHTYAQTTIHSIYNGGMLQIVWMYLLFTFDLINVVSLM